MNPYRELYMYLLSGVIDEGEEERLGGAFLGNWVEDGYSFLFFEAPSSHAVSEVLNGRSDLRLVEDQR